MHYPHHSCTVVRECCKGDDQSQRRKANFDAPPPLNPLTDLHQNLHRQLRRWYLPPCKIVFELDKGFRFGTWRLRTPLFTGLFLGGFYHLQPGHHHGHGRKVCQKTRFRTRMCLWRVAKPKFNIYTRFSTKTAISGPDFDGTLKFFGRKTALTLGLMAGLRVNDP